MNISFNNEKKKSTPKINVLLQELQKMNLLVLHLMILKNKFNSLLVEKKFCLLFQLLQIIKQNQKYYLKFLVKGCISKKLKVIKQCQNYLNQISNFTMEEKVQISQQILCKQLILERIGILVVLYKALSETYYSNQQNLKELSGLTSRIYEIFKCFISIQYNYVEMINCQQIPYLSKINKYTLIINLDDTLVHYQELVDDGQLQSYVQQQLKEISKYYGIVIFTAAQQDYVDFILDLRDEDKVIGIRLYSQHTTQVNNTYGKDIQRIGRDIKRTRIIDNLADNFTFQPDNGIQIQSLYGDKDDQALLFLSPLLIQIVQKKIPDVRDALRKFRDQIKILIQIQVMIDQSQREQVFDLFTILLYQQHNNLKMKQKSIITFLKLINQQQFLFYNEQVKIIQINKLICECLTKIKQNKFFRKNKDL